MDQFAPKAEPVAEPLNSSRISSIAYDSEEQTLDVTFTKGGQYRYFNVPQHAYEGLKTAPSAGQYFGSVIKRYPFEKF